MRVLVCGGRDFTNDAHAYAILDDIHGKKPISVVIYGDARGADRIGGQWAKYRKVESLKFPARWGFYGRSAGPRRNQQMLDEGRPDLVVAFPGGRGTADMIRRAVAAGVRVVKL